MKKYAEMNQTELLRELEIYQSRTDDKWVQIATKIGINKSIISSMRSGKYTGNNTAQLPLISAFLEREAVRQNTLQFNFAGIAKTSVVKEMFTVLQWAHTKKNMVMAVGGSGIGKTRAIASYKLMNAGVLRLEVWAGCTPRGLFGEILRLLKHEVKGSAERRREDTVRALTGKDYLLIIDEAQHLSYKCLELLRHVWDITKIGIAYIGSQSVLDRIADRRKIEYDQIATRLTLKRTLGTGINSDDIKSICDTAGIDCDPNMVKHMHNIVKKKNGYFRVMMNILEFAAELAEKNKQALNVGHLEAAEGFCFVN